MQQQTINSQPQIPNNTVPQQPEGQHQMQQQQHLASSGLNGGWQSEDDLNERRRMIAKIVQLLQARKPNAPQDWLSKLPQMAKRLEETLYRQAASFTEYSDASTLKNRLQQLAMRMKQPRPGQVPVQGQQQTVLNQTPNSIGIQHQIPLQQPPVHQISTLLPQNVQQAETVTVGMNDINPVMATNPQQTQTQIPLPVVHPASSQRHFPQNPINVGNRVANAVAPASDASVPPKEPSGDASGGSRSGSDRAQVLRHQQQRLLLLRHAAKCPHEDGRCPVTPHCAGMKRLWKHIAECKNQKCQVPHCVSSRYVLSHYHRCKDVRCPVCGPVREAIHRSHEKQKQMTQLKHGHEQALRQNGAASLPGQPQQVSTQPPAKRSRVDTSAPLVPTSTVPSGSFNTAQVTGNTSVAAPSRADYVYNRPTTSSNTGIRAPPPKAQEDLSLINSLTIDQIEKHIQSLNRGLELPQAELKSRFGEVLRALMEHQNGWVFNTPVDPIELGLPDYFQVIKKPMDLGSIKKRLENGCYHSLEELEADVNLTFDNAMEYNPDGSVVFNMAKELKDKFTLDYSVLIRKLKAEEERKRCQGDACGLCGCEKLLFEPPIFYCNGLKCPTLRIRRNSYYYVGGNNKYHWCHVCYGELKDNQEIQMPDATYKKHELVKKKNDEVREESWVHCDRCNRWIHQICGLFNTRKNQDQRSEYVCPRCALEERKAKKQYKGSITIPMAEDLQRTTLSEALESHIQGRVEEYIENCCKEKAERESISLEQATKEFDAGGPITIRQVTSMNRKLEVREKMKKRYAFKNYPDEFNFRCKCIIVFQNIDGVDVILFGLYVYEHDEKEPSPNTRSVYLSYLDSVHYMRPRRMRTFVYHEILIAYLDYVRKRGFSTVHIWACPPGKGDDYILYAKPEDQKTPRDDRLRLWYYDMLVAAQARGIVGKITNMYDLYFSNPKNDATMVPYMEGDYFPGEVENTIRDMEDGKLGKKAGSDGKKKKAKTKSKNQSSGRKGTRSGGIDEEALAASGVLPPGYDQKSMEAGQQDYVMTKLGQIIEPMKESFIVAYLAWEGAKEEDMLVSKEVMEKREKYFKEEKLREERMIQKQEAKFEANKKNNEEKNENDLSLNASDTAKDEVMEDVSSSNEPVKNGEVPEAIESSDKAVPDNVTSQKEVTDIDSKVLSSESKQEVPDAVGSKCEEGELKISVGEPSNAPKSTEESSPGNKEVIQPSEELKTESMDDTTSGNVISKENGTSKIIDDSNQNKNPHDGSEAAETQTETKVGSNLSSESSKPEDTQSKSDNNGSEINMDDSKNVELETVDYKNNKNLSSKDEPDEDVKKKIAKVQRDGKFAAMEARKRNLEGNIKKEDLPEKKDEDEKKSSVITVKDRHGRLVKVLDDDAEELDCEFLNNRQLFLELCQTNNYQFDQLRRAKHSSMMVLWHLHNRDAPKFVQQCAICAREILAGYRYHCATCADYDLCQDCFQKQAHNPNRHPHQLKPIPVAVGQKDQQTEEQRKERQRSIQLHMTLLMHAATCDSLKCQSQNCAKMKNLLKHGDTCPIKAGGGCNVCKRIWTLLQIHAKQCKEPNCPVPKCHAIRERFRQIALQQRAMDDRRRKQMNIHYHQQSADS